MFDARQMMIQVDVIKERAHFRVLYELPIKGVNQHIDVFWCGNIVHLGIRHG
jgi:hypothetical protein